MLAANSAFASLSVLNTIVYCVKPLFVICINWWKWSIKNKVFQPMWATGRQTLILPFNTESEAKLLFGASIGWKWSIKNKVYTWVPNIFMICFESEI